MSIVRNILVYGMVAAVGWGVHEAVDALYEANAAYVLAEQHGHTIITRKSDGVALPADMLFENYRLSRFMKQQLDGLEEQYQEFMLPHHRDVDETKSIDGLLRRLDRE